MADEQQTATALAEGTGEVVALDAPDIMGALRSYAEAEATVTALRLRRSDIIERLRGEDAELDSVLQDLERAERTVEQVEATLAEAIPDERRVEVGEGITLDVGYVRVTWPKPAVRWSQSVKPATIAQTDPELAKRLGISQKLGKPAKPRITVRADRL